MRSCFETVTGDASFNADVDVMFVLGGGPPLAYEGPVITWVENGGAADARTRGRDRIIGPWPGAWRSLVLPVADALFDSAPRRGRADVRRGSAARPPGRGAITRSSLLTRSSWSSSVAAEPPPAPVALNIHETGAPAFEHRAALALAAGCVLVSETLAPSHGFEGGWTSIEARTLDDLFLGVENAAADAGSVSTDAPARPREGGALPRVGRVRASRARSSSRDSRRWRAAIPMIAVAGACAGSASCAC